MNKKNSFRHGFDCAHFVSWYSSSLSWSFSISQPSFFASQRVHSSTQQGEQRLRMRSLELCHGVSCISIVWTPSRSTQKLDLLPERIAIKVPLVFEKSRICLFFHGKCVETVGTHSVRMQSLNKTISQATRLNFAQKKTTCWKKTSGCKI